MELLDHFRPPLSQRRRWHSFHNTWAANISARLNQILPEGYFAEANVQFGIEIDVAALKESEPQSPEKSNPEQAQWSPQSPTLTLPFTPAADAVEIAVFSTGEGPTLVGAVELLSPGNKDRVASRNAFTSKCETYLQQGAGLVVVDVVTTLQANLHTELMNRLEMTPSRSVDPLYAVAYRVADHNGAMQLEVWEESLALGNPLPTLPLWLKGGLYMPIELSLTYGSTCRENRIP